MQEKNLCFVPVWRRDACVVTVSSPCLDAIACACELTFLLCAWMHVSPAGSVNMHTLQLPHSMYSLSQEESGFHSPCVCAHVCRADLQDECRPKHKSGSGLCPSHRYVSDYHVVPLQLQGHNIRWDMNRNLLVNRAITQEEEIFCQREGSM